MGTFTAHALVGTPHQHHGGIVPSHRLYLSENDRLAWILVPESAGDGPASRLGHAVTWVPSLENMLEDALLMIALHVVHDRAVHNAAGPLLARSHETPLVLYDVIEPEQLLSLYELCRNSRSSYKLVLTVLTGSTIRSQLGVLERYSMDVEVCLPVYSRSHSGWRDSIAVNGTLEGL